MGTKNLSKHELHQITSVNTNAITLLKIGQWDAGLRENFKDKEHLKLRCLVQVDLEAKSYQTTFSFACRQYAEGTRVWLTQLMRGHLKPAAEQVCGQPAGRRPLLCTQPLTHKHAAQTLAHQKRTSPLQVHQPRPIQRQLRQPLLRRVSLLCW